MKEVTIKSKIVGREGSGTGIPSPSSPSASVDLSLYLKKEVWDDAFELKETEDGVPYIFGKLPVLLQYGLTMYADPEQVSVPSLFDGIPIDNNTIYWDETTNADGSVTRVLKAKGVGGEGGSADFGNVLESGTGNAFTSFSISEDGKELTLVKGETFAKQTDLNALSTKLTDFLEGSDTDNIINKWKELEAFLDGMSESSDLADILSGKADNATTLSGYGITNAYTKTETDDLLDEKADWGTTLSHYGITNAYTKTEVTNLLEDYLPLTGGTITGDLRLRTGSEYTSPYLYFGDSDEVYLKEDTDQYLTIHADKGIVLDTPLATIDGIEIKKSADGVLYIDANLVVSGGITMYGTDGTTSSSIWDGAPIASTSVKGIASFDSEFFAVSNGKVTFIGETGGGGASSWDDLEGKPSWIGSTKPSYLYSEIIDTPTSLKNPTALSWSGYSSGSYDGSTAKSIVIPSNTNQLTNGAGFISEVTKAMVTSALGYTPYNSTNPNGYVTSSGSVAYATSSGSCTGNAATATELENARTIWGQSFDGSGNVTGNMTGVGSITGLYYKINPINSNRVDIEMPGHHIQTDNNKYLWFGPYTSIGIRIDTSGNTAAYGNLLVTGGITMYSDERKKTILNHVELSLKEVAEAPLIEHYYNSDDKKTTHVGSIAQYWAGLNDWFCKKDGDGFYTMEIQNAALASAISVAREVVRLKNKISELEKEIERLKAA